MQVPTHLTPPNRLQVRITVGTVKTIKGKPIKEDQIDAWVTEAENGYDIEFLRAGGRQTERLSHIRRARSRGQRGLRGQPRGLTTR